MSSFFSVPVVPTRLVDLDYFLGYHIKSLNNGSLTPFAFFASYNRARLCFLNHRVTVYSRTQDGAQSIIRLEVSRNNRFWTVRREYNTAVIIK